MVKLIPVLVALFLAGCSRCPQECTAEALSSCDNRPGVIKKLILDNLTEQQQQINAYDKQRSFFQPSFDSKLNDVVDKYQNEWNENRISTFKTLDQTDLQLICKFATEDTFGLGELQSLLKILKSLQDRERVANQQLLSRASLEAIALTN